ncbi:MAG: hypothetical protein ACTHMC_09850 [Pseudobacter sp.]|uniref:hypothetical protein n=1 Tax=Pseudobacter sp. TaxID=2045420 RepID=UPI003F7F286E
MSQLALFAEPAKPPESRYWIEKLAPMLKEKGFDGSAKKAWKILRKTEFPGLFMAMYLAQKEWIIKEINQ